MSELYTKALSFADSILQIQTLLNDIEETENRLTAYKGRFAALQSEIQQFERRYYDVIGLLYAQLDEVKAQIAEHHARFFPESDELAIEADKAREIATNTAQEASSHTSHELNREQDQAQPETELPTSKPTQSARSMKREIAKRLHPDLAQDDAGKELCHQIMVVANGAFDSGDVDGLARMLSDLSMATENAHTLEAVRIAHLTIYLAQVQRQLAKVEASNLELESRDIFQIKKQCEEAEGRGIDLLTEMVCDIQIEIAQALQHLEQMQDEQEEESKRK